VTISSGTKLGRYEIRSQIGAGGMGEVYRAFDPKINRQVAIKVLPAAFSADKDRLARFEQEAQAAGALNHPNILAIYDVDTHEGAPYVVSELLAGEVLRDCLRDGPLSIRKGLDYGLEITRGLQAAHEKGIVHRDIKPENIFITSDGRIKILDFGLAKLTTPFDADGAQTEVPTRKHETESGVVLGTAGYMSPEQVYGRAVDQRSDIFSFGAVLYEMLSGRQAFRSDSAVETMNAILKQDPPELSQTIGLPLERVLRRCLAKKPSERFQSAGDLGFALEAFSGLSSSATTESASPPPSLISRGRLGWLAAAATLLMLLFTLPFALGYFRRSPTTESRSVRFTVAPPEKTSLIKLGDIDYSVAVSPDGLRLALVAVAQGKTQLWIRSLNDLTLQPLAGTEGANDPFWSPDSRFLAFFADGKLKKIDVAGGPSQTICIASNFGAGTWSGDDVILFNKGDGGIHRVAGSGGEPVQITKIDPAQEEYHVWPQFLPDNRHFLYLAGNRERDASRIYVGSLDGSAAQPLLQANSRIFYASPGYLLYVRDSVLLAQPFDAKALRLTGDSTPIAEKLIYFKPTGDSDFSVSQNGVLAFKTGPILTRLVWLNRSGEELGSVGSASNYSLVRLSPDGQRIAAGVIDPLTGMGNIWLLESSRNASKRVTYNLEHEIHPIWSSDGRQLVFAIDRGGPPHLFRKNVNDASDPEQLLPVGNGVQHAFDWSPDGQQLFFGDGNPATRGDIWILPMTGERKPYPFLRTRFEEWDARISSDGRWVAYHSNESGRPEVYVSPTQNSGEKWQISNSGGQSPRWRHDQKELFYVAADGNLMAVPIKNGANFEAGSPVALFKVTMEYDELYDVASDGQRFLINTNAGAPALFVTVVTNWTANLKR
jgi:serine/threonine protein kinase